MASYDICLTRIAVISLKEKVDRSKKSEVLE
jgi:hypothetical protein